MKTISEGIDHLVAIYFTENSSFLLYAPYFSINLRLQNYDLIHTSLSKVTVGTTTYQNIVLQVAIFSPFLLIPNPVEALRVFLPFDSFSSTRRLQSLKIDTLIPT